MRLFDRLSRSHRIHIDFCGHSSTLLDCFRCKYQIIISLYIIIYNHRKFQNYRNILTEYYINSFFFVVVHLTSLGLVNATCVYNHLNHSLHTNRSARFVCIIHRELFLVFQFEIELDRLDAALWTQSEQHFRLLFRQIAESERR